MGTPWVEEDQKTCHNRPEMPSIPHKRISGTHRLSPCPMIATRSRMTLWCIPPGLNGTGEKEETTTGRHQRERRHGPNGCRKKLNLPIFRDSTSDNAITYDDWRSEVDNYVREGHSHQLIRDSVLSALEGRPCHTAKAAMVDGDGSLKSIMSTLDQVYGGTTTYTTHLNKLNSIQQGMPNLPRTTMRESSR